jgi:hypothetical protein
MGHWVVYALYAVPVVIVLISIAVSVVRDRPDRTPTKEAA